MEEEPTLRIHSVQVRQTRPVLVLRPTLIALLGLCTSGCVSHWRGQEISADIEGIRAQVEQQVEDQRALRKKLDELTEQLEQRLTKVEAKLKTAVNRLQNDSVDSDTAVQTLKDEVMQLRGDIAQFKFELSKTEAPAKETIADTPPSDSGPKLPTEAKALYAYGYERNKAKDCPEAVRAFTQYYNKYPRRTQADSALYMAAKCLFAAKDYKGSIRNLNLIMTKYKTGKKVDDALELTHDAFLKLNKCSTALAFIEELVDQHPTYKHLKRARRKLKKTKKKCGS